MSEVEVRFPVEQDDETGYPPAKWEWIWCQQTDRGTLIVDNIPFFAREVSFGDEILATHQEGLLTFKDITKKSSESTIHVLVHDTHQPADIRRAIDRLGCKTELSDIPGVFTASMPNKCAEETLKRAG